MSVLIIAFSQKGHAQEDRYLWNTYKLGDEHVGFQVFHTTDDARMLNESTKRPVQISFWYPTEQEQAGNFLFRDYFLLSETETGAHSLFNEDSVIHRYKALAIKSGVTKGGIDAVFSARMNALQGATVKEGDYPLVLVAQGNGHSIFNQVIFCEYLASYGYYVVSVPSPMRISGSYADYEGLVSKTMEQAEDLKYAKGLIERKFAHKNLKTGMMAYSFGGRSAITYLHQAGELDALVSWDSGLANEYGKEWTEYLDNFEPSDIDLAVAHFYQPGDRSVKPDFELVEAIRNKNKFLVKIDSINHGFFMIRGAADGAFSNFQERPYHHSAIKYQRLLSLSKDFFDLHLKNSGKGLSPDRSDRFVRIEDISNDRE